MPLVPCSQRFLFRLLAAPAVRRVQSGTIGSFPAVRPIREAPTMTRSSFFTVQAEGPVTVVKFTEKHLNDTNVQQIGEQLLGLAGQLGQGELHLDFSDVNYLSTSVMAKLLTLHKRVTKEGGRFVLTNVNALYEMFSVTRLDTLMDIRRKQDPGEVPPANPLS
jgi:anti-anti-sigma factor